MKEFQGQVAVVTGAARGLGFAVARILAERGATVYLADVQREALEHATAELVSAELSAIASHTDVTDEVQLAALRDEIASRHGRIDVLVNNAGGWRYESIREITAANWDWTFRTNLLSVLLASRAFMDLMIARRYGRIVNVASADAYRAKPTLPAYAAAKAGVVSLTKTFAL